MDKILRTITSDGSLMASAIDSSQIVYTAQKIHGLTKTSCAALGRLLTGASLMGNMLKTDGASLTLKVNGGGPLGNLVAISDSHGNVRGYVDFPEVELPLKPNGKIDVGGGVGNLIDRVLNGVVVDYINVLFMRFAIFNFADICVCVGVALWVLVIFLEEVQEQKES